MTGGNGAAIGKQLYSAGEIESAILRLAAKIADDYQGQPLVLLGVLKGALYFTVDLSRALAEIAAGPREIIVDYLCVLSYGSLGRSSGQVKLLLDESVPIEGRHVVIAEDIADNGLTLSFLGAFLKERRPASLRTCVLFDKPSRRRVAVSLDYVGLPVPDTFVVGYGLDYQERYRSLPYVAELKSQGSRFES
jgi:hypoxanthine phosphoribosyltransferase